MIAAAALALLLAKQATAAEVVIHNAYELAELSYNVYSGTSYSGTTVFLDADIDFSELSSSKTFYPIGRDSNNYFQGVFDGQGYTISNLNIKNNIKYAGLFGYSKGTTIKNVVLDSNCNIESTYTSDSVYVGGILGQCISSYAECIVENCVNMGSVSYNQYTSSYYSYIGGIAGYFSTDSYDISITNCANYGDVIRSYTYYYTYIGGIAGRLYEDDYLNDDASIVNCLNSGAIIIHGQHSSSYSELYVGGIVGYGRWAEISNCMNVGRIINETVPDRHGIGSIVGYGEGGGFMEINHCIWSKETDVERCLGTSSDTIYIVGSYSVDDVNETTIGEMNVYTYEKYGLSKWAMNPHSLDVYFRLSDTSAIILRYNVILLPTPADTLANRTFDGWYIDKLYENVFYGNTITEKEFFIKRVEGILVSFADSYGFSGVEVVVRPGKPYGLFPDVKRPAYKAEFYNSPDYSGKPITPGTIVTNPSDHTIYVKWVSDTYFVTFDFGNGTSTLIETGYSKKLQYPDVSDVGYRIFHGWTPMIKEMPAKNVTITAVWSIKKFSLTFYDGYNTKTTTEIEYGAKVIYPKDPERIGYKFVQWDKDIQTMPAEDITITAQWKAIYYTATFDLGNKTILSKLFTYDEEIVLPDGYEREYHTFLGLVPDYDHMPAKNVSFTIIWDPVQFSLTFYDGYSRNISSAYFGYGDLVIFPHNPERFGYEFDGWDKDITYMPPENITITAKWKVVYYTATFDFGDEANVTRAYRYGEEIVYPQRERIGMVFVEWYPWGYSDMPARNMTFTAIWENETFFITFDYGYKDDDEEEITREEEFEYNEVIKYPADPTRTGYEFVKWVSDSGVNITYMPARNVTFTAEWTHIQYVVTFFEEDEQTVLDAQKLYYDDAVIYPEVTTKGTRKFYSWDYKFSKMPAGDINVTVIRKDVPTAQVKMQVQGEKGADELRDIIKLYTDKEFAVKDAKSGSGVTTATIIFDDKVLAEMFVDKVVDKFGSGSGAYIMCEYHYYEGYDDNTRRNSYHASGAGGLAVSAMSFVFVFLLGF